MPIYRLPDMVLTVNGIRIEGFGVTDAIMIARDEDSFTKTVGADGEVTKSSTNNDSGTITITLMQNAFANGALELALLLDELTGDITFPVVVADPLRTGWEIVGTECWIKKPPDIPFNKAVGELTWVLDVAHLTPARLPSADEFASVFASL